MGYWRPGALIIHQIVLENYAYLGGMMVGTDSHTPNAGGMGMIAIGVGGADAVDVMADLPLELTAPRIIGVRFAQSELRADNGAEYDKIIEIDLPSLEPIANGPFTPDLSTPISRFGQAVSKEARPSTLTAGLIGSCTNSSFEDMSRAASLGQQALDAGLKPKMNLLVSQAASRLEPR
ncbi:aconitate hydratase 1 [Exophiala aquamarina CBS 119918]|uniref:Aconitate hydratase 1 n=1 Tax=Exophiala aquamarina CBS 119918 TaxID=1182545 RepID=A0A072NZF0_9EURO|nr:aconitate hydratase 1 [Exophiala aquamarina CBS 119918]KEF53254.1 aconitate hydratase 1 [Exophiala aquamarina CBS 119918]